MICLNVSRRVKSSNLNVERLFILLYIYNFGVFFFLTETINAV